MAQHDNDCIRESSAILNIRNMVQTMRCLLIVCAVTLVVPAHSIDANNGMSVDTARAVALLAAVRGGEPTLRTTVDINRGDNLYDIDSEARVRQAILTLEATFVNGQHVKDGSWCVILLNDIVHTQGPVTDFVDVRHGQQPQPQQLSLVLPKLEFGGHSTSILILTTAAGGDVRVEAWGHTAINFDDTVFTQSRASNANTGQFPMTVFVAGGDVALAPAAAVKIVLIFHSTTLPPPNEYEVIATLDGIEFASTVTTKTTVGHLTTIASEPRHLIGTIEAGTTRIGVHTVEAIVMNKATGAPVHGSNARSTFFCGQQGGIDAAYAQLATNTYTPTPTSTPRARSVTHTLPGLSGFLFRGDTIAGLQYLIETFADEPGMLFSVQANVSCVTFDGRKLDTVSVSNNYTTSTFGVTAVVLPLKGLHDSTCTAESSVSLVDDTTFESLFHVVSGMPNNAKGPFDEPSEKATSLSMSKFKILWPQNNTNFMEQDDLWLVVTLRLPRGHASPCTVTVTLDGDKSETVDYVGQDGLVVPLPMPTAGRHIVAATVSNGDLHTTAIFEVTSREKIFQRTYVPPLAALPQYTAARSVTDVSKGQSCAGETRADDDDDDKRPERCETDIGHDDRYTAAIAFPDTTLVVLSWNAPETLANTLESYHEGGLLDMVNRTIVFVQEMSYIDIMTLSRFPRTIVVGDKDNWGIGRAFLALAYSVDTKYFVFFEHDWTLSRFADWVPTFREARRLVASGVAQAARLRDEVLSPVAFDCHVPNPITALNDPELLMNGLYCDCMTQRVWTEPPHMPTDYTGPQWWAGASLQRLTELGVSRCPQPLDSSPFYCMPGRLCGFSNNPILYDTKMLIDILGSVMAADPGTAGKAIDPFGWKFYLEKYAYKLWPVLNITVAVPYRGIFMHAPLPK